MNDQGTVVRFPGTQKPKISLEPGVLVGLFELGDQISIGSGFWLELCDDGAECTNSIGPVLEGR